MILLLVLFRLIPNISFLLSLCSSPHSGAFGIWSWSHHSSEAQRLRHQSRVHGLGRGRSRGWRRWDILNLYALISDCIFSILFTIHFQRCWQGEFIEQSRVSLVGDHFLYSHDLNAWFNLISCLSLLGVKLLRNICYHFWIKTCWMLRASRSTRGCH